MPDPLRIQGNNARTCLIENLVEKRVRTCEYFRQLHTREDTLWMNTIRLGKLEIGEYFGVDRTVLDPKAKYIATSNKVVIRHMRTESMSSAGGGGSVRNGSLPNASSAALEGYHEKGGGGSSVLSSMVEPTTTVPLRSMDGRTVSPSWLEEYLPKYFALGVSLADLLLIPMSGPDFVDALLQLFMEIDVYFATSAASRVLAGRTLKNHRWARAQNKSTTAVDMDKSPVLPNTAGSASSPTTHGAISGSSIASSPSIASPATGAAVVSSKPHLLTEMIMRQSVPIPSYDLVVPSLCTTIIFAYRRMCDFDATEDPDAVRMILQVDRRFKKLFFGNISKELNKLAQVRVLQQAFVLTDHLFGAFSQADDSLVRELLRAKQPAAAGGDAASAVEPQEEARQPEAQRHVDVEGFLPPISDDEDDDY